MHTHCACPAGAPIQSFTPTATASARRGAQPNRRPGSPPDPHAAQGSTRIQGTRHAVRLSASIERAASNVTVRTPCRLAEALETTVQELMSRFHVPGVSIAVIKDFKIEWARGYGTMDVQTGMPVNVEELVKF